ncbi:MAG: hydrolase [Candidatus Micrarchaeia archaeon]
MTKEKLFETGCCPRFNPKPWQNKTLKWKSKLFVKDSVSCFFHIPLGMDKVMTKNMALITAAGAKNPESIMLMDDRGLFASDIYIAVDKNVPGAQMATLSGSFLSRVYEGDYKEAGKWAQDMASYVKNKGLALKKLYFSYTTCPACAKAYGKNYVVLFAAV